MDDGEDVVPNRRIVDSFVVGSDEHGRISVLLMPKLRDARCPSHDEPLCYFFTPEQAHDLVLVVQKKLPPAR